MTTPTPFALLRDHAAGRHAVRPEPACRSCAAAVVRPAPTSDWVERAKAGKLKAKELGR